MNIDWTTCPLAFYAQATVDDLPPAIVNWDADVARVHVKRGKAVNAWLKVVTATSAADESLSWEEPRIILCSVHGTYAGVPIRLLWRLPVTRDQLAVQRATQLSFEEVVTFFDQWPTLTFDQQRAQWDDMTALGCPVSLLPARPDGDADQDGYTHASFVPGGPTVKAAEGLRFYPSSHRYKLDGLWVPGATTILNVLAKPALTKWASKSVAEYVADHPEALDHLYEAGRAPMVAMLKEVPWQKSKDAADRGTTFHELAEAIVNGQEVEVPLKQEPLVESALAFLKDYDIEPVLVEAAVGSREHKYAGKLDLIANDAIWDWKSGKRIYPSTALQLVAYAFAEFYGENGDEKPLPEVKESYGVHIREDGYDVIPLKFSRDVYEEFLSIRRVYDINKRVEGDWKVPGSGYAGLPLTRDLEWELAL